MQSEMNIWQWTALCAITFLVGAAAGCGGGTATTTGGKLGGGDGSSAGVDGGGGGTVSANGFLIAGQLGATVNGQQVSIDYAGGQATAQMVHKKLDKPGAVTCFTSVEMTLAKADGSCMLVLQFGVGIASEKELVKAEFHAVKALKQAGAVIETTPCLDWPGAKDAKGEIVYSLTSGEGVMNVGALKGDDTAKADVLLKGKVLKPQGKVKLKSKGQMIDLDLGSISVTGDVKSTGSAIASCGTATGMNLCPKNVGDKESNDVGSYMKRKPGLVDCNTEEEVDFGEFCGNDAVWVTVYRGWSLKACGGCEQGESCYKHFKEENVYTPTCVSETTDCSPACDSAKVCVKTKCEERISDGEDMALKDVLEDYANVFTKSDKAVKLAAAFVIAEGNEKARGKCKEKEPGKLECDGKGKPATQDDCKAAKEKYKIPDTVRMYYDKSGKGWSSDKRFGGPYSNSMLITNSDLSIVNSFPEKGKGSPGSSEVSGAIEAAKDK